MTIIRLVPTDTWGTHWEVPTEVRFSPSRHTHLDDRIIMVSKDLKRALQIYRPQDSWVASLKPFETVKEERSWGQLKGHIAWRQISSKAEVKKSELWGLRTWSIGTLDVTIENVTYIPQQDLPYPAHSAIRCTPPFFDASSPQHVISNIPLVQKPSSCGFEGTFNVIYVTDSSCWFHPSFVSFHLTSLNSFKTKQKRFTKRKDNSTTILNARILSAALSSMSSDHFYSFLSQKWVVCLPMW